MTPMHKELEPLLGKTLTSIISEGADNAAVLYFTDGTVFGLSIDVTAGDPHLALTELEKADD